MEIRLLTDPVTKIGKGCGFLEVKTKEAYTVSEVFYIYIFKNILYNLWLKE